jgi:hypothetical protein
MRISANLVAWGPAFVDRLLTWALPGLMAPGNLPALASRHQLDLRVYTTPADAGALERAPLFQRLRALMPVRFLDVGALEPDPMFAGWAGGKFHTMSLCHLDAIRAAETAGTGLLFLVPDNLYSDGALAQVAKLAEGGASAVLMAPLPVFEPTFMPACADSFRPGADGSVAMPPRRLAALALEHSHPWNASMVPGPEGFRIASHLHWPLPGEGILGRVWHLHPLFIRPSRPTARFFHSIDNDWTCQALADGDRMHVVQDSDELTCLEPLPADCGKTARDQPYPFTPLRWALAAEGLFPSPHNRLWASRDIRWHGSDLGPDWDVAARQARTTVERIGFWAAWLDPDGWPAAALDASQLAEAEAMGRALRDEARTFAAAAPGNPPAAHTWANLAKLCGALGRAGEARQALVEMLRLSPGNPFAERRAARLALALDRCALPEPS